MKKVKPAKKAKAPKPPKIRKTETATIPVQHTFSPNERDEIARDMAAKMTTRGQVDDQLKAISADFKSRIKTIDAEISERHSKFSLGYEFRDTKVIVHFNKASDEHTKKPIKKLGYKRIVRADDGSWVKDEQMTAADMSTELFEKQKLEAESKRAKAEADRKAAEEKNKRETGETSINTVVVPAAGERASTAATA